MIVSTSNMTVTEQYVNLKCLKTEGARTKIGAKRPFVDYQQVGFWEISGIENLNSAPFQGQYFSPYLNVM